MSLALEPIARSPLAQLQAREGATQQLVDGWMVATSFPREPASGGNAIVDLSHWSTHEINGAPTGDVLMKVCGADVPLRQVLSRGSQHVYRLMPTRAILLGFRGIDEAMLDVTGGWATLALMGPDAEAILNKVTALDLRERTLPVGSCCQGPVFGVNTLFGRLPGRFELHVCTDSVEFFWEVLMDAGRELDLAAAGTEYYARHAGTTG